MAQFGGWMFIVYVTLGKDDINFGPFLFIKENQNKAFNKVLKI